MADYRTYFDSNFLFAFHLQGRELTVIIDRVTGGELTGEGGRKTKKPVAYFRGKEKPLALNKTNCKTIAALYGTDTKNWIGEPITIYPTTTTMGSETVDCIRVRPERPVRRNGRAPQNEAPPPADEADSDSDSLEPGSDE